MSSNTGRLKVVATARSRLQSAAARLSSASSALSWRRRAVSSNAQVPFPAGLSNPLELGLRLDHDARRRAQVKRHRRPGEDPQACARFP